VETVNNKGSFREDNSFGKKLTRFFKESGFYIAIVVGLCVLAAGAVYFSTNQILTDPEPNQAQENMPGEDNIIGKIDFNVPEEEDEDSIIGSTEDNTGTDNADDGPLWGLDEEPQEIIDEEPSSEDISEPNEQMAGGQEQAKVEPKPESESEDVAKETSGNTGSAIDDNSATEDVVLAIVRPAFIAPVDGPVQSEYSMDKLVFSPTFNEWRTHSGVDIAAPRGEVVRAVGDGVVLEIKNDPRFGFTVVIDHKNGYKSLYANRASDKTLQVGQEVKQGDPIGSVGSTAIFESAEPTHLHFELYKENKLVDPADYIDLAKE